MIRRSNLRAGALTALAAFSALIAGCAAPSVDPYSPSTVPVVLAGPADAGVRDLRARYREAVCRRIPSGGDTCTEVLLRLDGEHLLGAVIAALSLVPQAQRAVAGIINSSSITTTLPSPSKSRFTVASSSPCSDAALNDLRRAGLPAVVHALVLTVADIILLSSGDEGGEDGGLPADPDSLRCECYPDSVECADADVICLFPPSREIPAVELSLSPCKGLAANLG